MSRVVATMLIAVTAIAVGLYLVANRPAPRASHAPRASPTDLVALSRMPYTPVRSPPALRFPEDHAAHPDYRTEGWILSGLIEDGQGRFGAMQLYMLRVRLVAAERPRDSRWATSEVYAGMLALALPDEEVVRVAQRVTRANPGLAGASGRPLTLWIEDWRLSAPDQESDSLELTGRFAAADVSVQLTLSSSLTWKESEARLQPATQRAAPFAYYARPLIDATGSLSHDQRSVPFRGRFVLEHAWGELPLPGSPVARDRFALFLEDGRQLLLAQTHRTDGSGTPRAAGLLVGADGVVSVVAQDAVALEPLEHWSSAETGTRYPVRWRLRIRNSDIDARLVPERTHSEGVSWSPFWLGSVRLQAMDGGPIGAGTVFLTGYGGTW